MPSHLLLVIRSEAMAHGHELLTTAEMAEADRLAPGLGMPSLVLMENAGRAVASEAMRMVPCGARIAVLCGPGNNGGDGFVAARLLREAGYAVAVACTVDVAQLQGDAAVMAQRWGGPIEPHPAFAARPTTSDPLELFAGARDDIPAFLSGAALVIDAMLGAGLARPIGGLVADYVLRLAVVGGSDPAIPVLAVDVPTGLDGTTGDVPGGAGPAHVVMATRTVTFFRRKPGHVLLPGRLLCGQVVVADIGMPETVLDRVAPAVFVDAPALWRHCFPRVRTDGHKYTRGHAVVVSGGIEMSGAARLCARGALRIGAGLVTVVSPPDALQAHAAQLNATLLKTGTEPADLQRLLADERYTAVAIGPGLGRAEGALARVMAVLGAAAAVVLDADAITVAAVAPDALFGAIASAARPVVLTPHEGEFKRLFPDLAGSKLERARRAARRSGAVVLLKGPDTVIAAPDGRAAINENAPPTLATAGSGDVLAGFVTGLVAQRMPAFEAAAAAVWLHGECANRFGPGLIAEDIAESLPGALATLAAE